MQSSVKPLAQTSGFGSQLKASQALVLGPVLPLHVTHDTHPKKSAFLTSSGVKADGEYEH